MAPEVAEVLETAKTLGRDEIADLAYHLLRVLDGETDHADIGEVSAAWRDEVRNRIHQIESGEVQLVDHDETVALARAALAARRG